MPSERPQRKLAAILAADVVGYSRLAGVDEDRVLARLRALRSDLIDPTIAVHSGRVVKRTGDGAIVEFRSIVDAVNCAVEIQNAMAERDAGVPEDRRIVFRIGIHIGDVVEESDGDLMGDGVNVAARLEGAAPPGGIVISGTARDAVGTKVAADFRDLGGLMLKNIERPVQAFQVSASAAERHPVLDKQSAAGVAGLSSGSAAEVSSIGVRPFSILSDERQLEFLAEGLAEDVIALLARMPGFFVIAKASSFVFRDPAIPTSTIAQQLGVRYILGGSVRTLGDQIRVSTQLADAASGRVLWSGQFNSARNDTTNLQDEITRGIVVELQPALTRAEIAVIRRKRPENIGAWDFYHQASGVLAADGWNVQAVTQAQLFLKRALELDASFALARAQFALLAALALNTALVERSELAHGEAVSAAERAIADDGGSSEVLGYAGCAIADLGDVVRGMEILQQAVELDPSNAQAQVALGAALALSGDMESGIGRMRHGIKLSPRDRRLAFWGWALGGFLLRAKRPGEALEEAKLAARRDPRLFLPPVLETLAHTALGRIDAARASLALARRLRPELALRHVEISHGRRAANALSEIWAPIAPNS
jgi:adenylate cyclase